eukprot:TRINITY_DN4015_c0_g1_i1.p1 TRINITY_DN4015_c0_g1~~TRINITY_DN4015_c0_g1_i1.p1  ORF type:complete len:856 (+),score=234.34 TRINITY_DN4015_c0_g1_i1:115-2682(+)
MAQTVDRVLLPKHIRPRVYKVTLEPDLKAFKFDGEEEIEFEVVEPTKQVVLNSKELVVHSASIGDQTATISYDKENYYVKFDFDKEINQNGTLKVKFSGELNNQMAGFYRAKYFVGEEERYMAVTQFEATDCRRALPCWDEPAIKAQFDVTLIVPKDRTALSNMPIVEDKDHPSKSDKRIVKFDRTPVMSTYLLAFAVAELDYVEGMASNGVPIRVYTQKGKSDQGRFSLEISLKVLPLLENTFKQKYPLPKLDLLAVSDFAFGAMENWGLVTFRETALLVDSQNTSTSAKQYVALVVAHELTHSWFGNLCTFAWWKDLFLNESFATWAEYLSIDIIHPEWKVFEQFVFSDFVRAQSLDALESSHPVEVDVRTADEIDEVFDAISYSKGCSLIRMLVNYLSLETFIGGVNTYLDEFKFSNATAQDLWNHLSKASGQDIASMMQSWTKKTGYPVVTITEVKVEGGKRHLQVEQHRFLEVGVKKEDDTVWHIPLGYITSKNSQPTYTLLKERSGVIEIDADVQWVKFNPEQIAFHRVNYPEKYFDELLPAIREKKLSAIDRLGIQDDVCALARAGALKSSIALRVLSAYENEDNYTVLSGLASNLAYFKNILKKESFYPKFQAFARKIFQSQGQALGWTPKEGESHLTCLTRGVAIAGLVAYSDEDARKKAKELFEVYKTDPSTVAPDLRTSMYRAVVAAGGDKEFDELLQIFRKNDLNEEKVRCLRSFGSTTKKELLERLLKFILTDEVRSQDLIHALSATTGNPEADEVVWNWFSDNFKTLRDKYGGVALFSRVVKLSMEGITSPEVFDRAKAFFQVDAHKDKAYLRSIAQGLEAAQVNVQWLLRSRDDLASFFA